MKRDFKKQRAELLASYRDAHRFVRCDTRRPLDSVRVLFEGEREEQTVPFCGVGLPLWTRPGLEALDFRFARAGEPRMGILPVSIDGRIAYVALTLPARNACTGAPGSRELCTQ